MVLWAIECGCCMQEGGERRSADAYVLCLDGCRPIAPSRYEGGSQGGANALLSMRVCQGGRRTNERETLTGDVSSPYFSPSAFIPLGWFSKERGKAPKQVAACLPGEAHLFSLLAEVAVQALTLDPWRDDANAPFPAQCSDMKLHAPNGVSRKGHILTPMWGEETKNTPSLTKHHRS